MIEWPSLFATYRAVVIRGDEVVQGILHSEVEPDDPRVRAVLAEWDGMHFLHHSPAGTELTLVRRVGATRRERWWLHLLLALLSLLTTTVAGAYLAGREPILYGDFPVGPWAVPRPIRLFPHELLPGIGFSVPLMLILLGHELGHYLVARRYRMDVSPPYFIPAPNWINFIGTFGAFIRLRSAVMNRVVLLDVGAGGPVASFLLSIPVFLLGLRASRWVAEAPPGAPSHQAVHIWGDTLWLGDSLLTRVLNAAGGATSGVWVLHPIAFAGWLGLFVTALNLFPLSQLDGGHILYALVGPRQRWAGLGFLAVLVVLGRWWWGWWFWALVILVLGRGSTRHPAVFDARIPVTGRRRLLGWACVFIFFLTFVWRPFPM